MIHPQYWSLYSVYNRIKYRGCSVAISQNDIDCYRTLPCAGMVVLDIGARDGDTAKLFLGWGASHVICIERNESYSNKNLLTNVTKIVEPFRLSHLDLKYDVIKCDIEGYEALLLDYDGVLKPTVMEVHSEYLKERFEKKGFRCLRAQTGQYVGACIMVNYNAD